MGHLNKLSVDISRNTSRQTSRQHQQPGSFKFSFECLMIATPFNGRKFRSRWIESDLSAGISGYDYINARRLMKRDDPGADFFGAKVSSQFLSGSPTQRQEQLRFSAEVFQPAGNIDTL